MSVKTNIDKSNKAATLNEKWNFSATKPTHLTHPLASRYIDSVDNVLLRKNSGVKFIQDSSFGKNEFRIIDFDFHWLVYHHHLTIIIDSHRLSKKICFTYKCIATKLYFFFWNRMTTSILTTNSWSRFCVILWPHVRNR